MNIAVSDSHNDRGIDVPLRGRHSPSELGRRVPVVVLALAGIINASYLALFQEGIIAGVWDPFFGRGSEHVLTSLMQLPSERGVAIPDTTLIGIGYLLILVLALCGDRDRWKRTPWVVVMLGATVYVVALMHLLLILLEPVLFHAWCAPCLWSSALIAGIAVPVGIEAVASVRHLRSSAADVRSGWPVFWELQTPEARRQQHDERLVFLHEHHEITSQSSSTLPPIGMGDVVNSSSRPPLWTWMVTGVAAGVALVAFVWLAAHFWWLIFTVHVELLSAPPREGVTLREVVYSPEEFYGERVVVSARALHFVDPHATLIGNDRIVSPEDILVITTLPFDEIIDMPVGRDDVLRVDGIVAPFGLPKFEEELGIRFTNAGALHGYNLHHAIVAETITVNPLEASQESTENPVTLPDLEAEVTDRDIVYDTGRFLGQEVTVSGEVEERISPNAFILSDQGILVLSQEPPPGVIQEATAYVTGTVRRFDREKIAAEVGIQLDADRYDRFDDWPVVVTRPELVVVVR